VVAQSGTIRPCSTECGRVPDPTHQKRPLAGAPAAPEAARSAYTVEGAGLHLGGIGRTTVYGLIAAGKLEAVKLGSRTLITAASIDALLASLPRALKKPESQRNDTAR
jgi:excisionase family DNA binding protein